jgi:DNA polymerase-3 subunit delta'
MNLNPINQEKLLGYDNLFNHFVKLFEDKKFPNKIILSGSKGIGKSTFAYHFINYILSKNEKKSYNINQFKIQTENRSFNLIKNLSHPNFHLIDLLEGKKIIEISQIRKAISYSQKSTFDGNYKIVLIDNIELLNLYSSNALLKIIEEPNEKLLFILIHNNSKKIIKTLESRCIVFKKQFTYSENLSIANDLACVDLKEFFNSTIINHYFTIGDFLHLYNFSKTNKLDIKKLSLKELLLYLINFKIYKNNSDLTNLIYKLIESYFHYTFLSKKNLNIYELYEYFIKKINYTNKFNLDIESLFLEFKNKVITNE